MLIERYEVTLEVHSEQDPLWKSPARGSLMHGLLMRNVRADSLHDGASNLRPYTQYLSAISYRQYLWTINTLHRERAASLIDWLDNIPQNLYLEHYDLSLKVTGFRQAASISYSDFIEKALGDVPPKFAEFELNTPLAFKKAGQQSYWLWPEARLIAQSALNRWNTFATASRFDDVEILEDISTNVLPLSFNLRTQKVAMDGIVFAGVVGNIGFRVQKNTAVRQVFHLCGLYSEFSGLGVKTAMGLGSVVYDKSRQRDQGIISAYRNTQEGVASASAQ